MRTMRLLAASWALVTIGALTLLVGYRTIPAEVVLYRLPGANTPLLGPKTFLSVGRVVLMGVGQLGAATAMVLAAGGSLAWSRFWGWLALVAAVKTLLECVGLLVHGSPLEQALTFCTLAVVGLFVLGAVRWWRRGDLVMHPPVTGGPRLWLLASLALWAVFAAIGSQLDGSA